MAEKRMFAKAIIDSDAFITMPVSTQCLYFHLCMRADDDGFVNNPKIIQRMIGSSDDDFKILLGKRFILAFDSGIIVIKHWRLHNYIRRDTYKETLYVEEKSELFIKPDGAYTDHELAPELPPRDETVTEPSRVRDETVTQIKEDKIRVDKDSIDNTLDDLQSSDVEEFYESIWALYPRKVGKGAVSKTRKQKLYRIGFDEMQRTIERYKAYIKAEGIEKQYIMHGSTFFNSGYVDFLDANFEQPKPQQQRKPRKGHLETITNEFGREEEVWKEDE